MTAGKRPRLMMRRTVSVASLGAEACGSDHPSDHPQQQQQQQPVHQPVHQVIGFAPKAYSESNKFMMQDTFAPMVFGEPASPHMPPSPPSAATRSGKPFSGLSLVSDAGKDASSSSSSSGDTNKVGLGIVVALENKDEMMLAGSSPVFRSSPAAAAAAVAVNSPRYLPPPDFNSAKHKSPAATFCFQSNSTKYDRCSLRPPFNTLGFLKSCYLCKRDISHGHDIYMYRGDRAFCSAECRHQQILNDERSERKCSSAALKQMGGVNQQQPRAHQRSKVSTAPATTAAAA